MTPAIRGGHGPRSRCLSQTICVVIVDTENLVLLTAWLYVPNLAHTGVQLSGFIPHLENHHLVYRNRPLHTHTHTLICTDNLTFRKIYEDHLIYFLEYLLQRGSPTFKSKLLVKIFSSIPCLLFR